MYLIAVCGDDKTELEKTDQILEEYKKIHPRKRLVTELFEDVKEMLGRVREKDYTPDLVIIDFCTPQNPGAQVAKELRSLGSKSRLVFLSYSKEYALDAFSVNATQYLLKPVTEEMFFPLLDQVLEDIEREHSNYVLLRSEGRIQRVAVRDITYCEAQGKLQCLHLADGTQCQLRMTMAEIYEKLLRYREFVRVGIAYIVNLDYVDNLSAKNICLNTRELIYLPRGAYRPLREQYIRYYSGSGQEIAETEG